MFAVITIDRLDLVLSWSLEALEQARQAVLASIPIRWLFQTPIRFGVDVLRMFSSPRLISFTLK